MSSSSLLDIRDLTISYRGQDGGAFTTGRVSLTVGRSEVVGLQGPSGSGKTSLALAVLGVLPPAGRVVTGRIQFKGVDLLGLPDRELRSIRGSQIALVFQEPLGALNPLLTVGAQVCEGVRAHAALSRAEAWGRAEALLEEVGLEQPRLLLAEYPHQLSGGQRQRVLIASALAGDPELLLCDEPTAALDHPHQLRVLELLARLRDARRLSILLISHNTRAVEYLADRRVRMPAAANGGAPSNGP